MDGSVAVGAAVEVSSMDGSVQHTWVSGTTVESESLGGGGTHSI